MHKTLSLGWAQGPGWQLVELPYAGGKLVMDVIVPDSADLSAMTTADHDGPFLMAVRDLETNSLLFLGRVLDPKE